MKIAHVLSSFGLGGQERMALELARGLKGIGHEVIAISLAQPPEGPIGGELRGVGARVHSVPKREGFDFTLPWRLADVLRREAVDLVHTHNPQALIYGAPAARLAGAPVVHTKHGANPTGPRRLWLRRGAARLVGAYIAVSPTTAETARRQRDCAPSKLGVIPNGIDTARFRPDPEARAVIRAELEIPESAVVIGSVGRLAPEKNFKLLIHALGPLLGKELCLVLVGDGPEHSELRTLCEKMGISPFVRLTGARADVPQLLAAFDIFALSSLTEGLPLVVPEAMAVGLPVISTAVGGLPDVIEQGVSGYLVPPADEAALRMRLEQLSRDRVQAAALGRFARSSALARYSSERMLRDYLALYGRVVDKPGQRRRRRPRTGEIRTLEHEAAR